MVKEVERIGRLKFVLNLIAVLMVLLSVLLILQQTRGKATLPLAANTETSSMKDDPQPKVNTPPPDKWWTVQRNIETSIAHLEAYLKESPSGAYAQQARQQLEVLRGLSITTMLPNWVQLYDQTDWRIISVKPQPDKTSLTIQVRNRDSTSEYFFNAFDTSPLVLIDSSGQYYRMLSCSPAPQGVRVNPDFNDPNIHEWYLQGNRIITVTVDFQPLASGIASGQVQYRDNNWATPARFSLSEFNK